MVQTLDMQTAKTNCSRQYSIFFICLEEVSLTVSFESPARYSRKNKFVLNMSSYSTITDHSITMTSSGRANKS